MMDNTKSGIVIPNLPLLKRTLALWPYAMIAFSLAGFVLCSGSVEKKTHFKRLAKRNPGSLANFYRKDLLQTFDSPIFNSAL